MKYDDWLIREWLTPFSLAKSLRMVSLVDDGTLTITVEAAGESHRFRWQAIVDKCPSYRNLLEEYRMSLWEHLDDTGQRCGATFEVLNSPAIAEMKSSEPLLREHHAELRHFVLCTEDDIVEMFTETEPVIKSLGPVADDAPVPGKSVILVDPKDRKSIDKIIDDLGGAR